MTKTVDSYRFVSGLSRRLVKRWISMEVPRPIPWAPLTKPLSECTVALISTGGIALKTDAPFDQTIERQNPWQSDDSYRILPRTTNTEDIDVYHLHINPAFAQQDLNCIFPLRPLAELEKRGAIGRLAPSHYSFMGYILQPEKKLLPETAPAIVRRLQDEAIDVVILIPV